MKKPIDVIEELLNEEYRDIFDTDDPMEALNDFKGQFVVDVEGELLALAKQRERGVVLNEASQG